MLTRVLGVGWILTVIGTSGCGGGSTDETTGTELGHRPPARAPANSVGGFSIDVPEVTLAPGEESEPCYIFPIEISGPSSVVGGGVLHVGSGMHHGNINTRPKTGEGFRECPPNDSTDVGLDIVHGGSVLFASSTQVEGEEWQTLPDGIGYRIDQDFEIVARMHYLNTSDKPLKLAPKYEWFTIDEAKIDKMVGPFAWTYREFEIPAQSQLTVTGDCNFPAPMHLVNVLPHMHKLGTAFTGAYLGGPRDGENFLESKGYDPDNGVITQYQPAVDLSQGQGASFSCTWDNTLNKTIVEGIGDNEMCILFGYAWPPENAFTASAAAGGACVYVAPPVK